MGKCYMLSTVNLLGTGDLKVLPQDEIIGLWGGRDTRKLVLQFYVGCAIGKYK